MHYQKKQSLLLFEFDNPENSNEDIDHINYKNKDNENIQQPIEQISDGHNQLESRQVSRKLLKNHKVEQHQQEESYIEYEPKYKKQQFLAVEQQSNKLSKKYPTSRQRLIYKQDHQFDANLYQKGLLQPSKEDMQASYPTFKKIEIEEPRQYATKKELDKYNPSTETHPLHIRNMLKQSLQSQIQNKQKKEKLGEDFNEEEYNAFKKKNLSRKKLQPLEAQKNIEIVTEQHFETSMKKLPVLGKIQSNQQKGQPKSFNRKQKSLYPRPLVMPDKIQNVHEFSSKIIPPGQLLQTIVQRDRSGINRFYPRYNVYFSQSLKLIMSAQRKAFKLTSTYVMCSNQSNIDINSECYLGKTISNFTGSIFNIYDDGYNPTKIDNGSGKTIRELMATVHYESSSAFSTQPRTITVYIKKYPYKYLELKGAIFGKQEINLKQLYEQFPEENYAKIYKATNKKPIWSQQKSAYTLNFYGKMGMGSVKNMILVGQDQQQILLLAKSQNDRFHLDIGYPLIPKVALGIILSSFDFKWICQ